MYRNYLKRILDLSISIILFIIAFPLFVFLALILFITSRKVFFFQRRPGRYGKEFSIIKFKTMDDKIGEDGKLLPDSERLTKIGTIIRKYSLDELPQLLNVIVGDLSLVGPRPLLVEYLDYYNDYQKRRHEVRPGITGWAQVNGRNLISWTDRFALDVWYVDNVSFLLDMKILKMTIIKVLKSEGVNSKNGVTMKKFRGNESI